MDNQIDFCKKCQKRFFDPKQGIVCSLTYRKPAFSSTCPDFEKDLSIKDRVSASDSYSKSSKGSGGASTGAIIGIVISVVLIGARIVLRMNRSSNRNNTYQSQPYNNSFNNESTLDIEEIMKMLDKNDSISNDSLK